MSDLIATLAAIDHLSNVRPIAVTIRGTRYEGAAYESTITRDKTVYYLLGERPACYLRSSRTVFVIDGADWYVQCYMPAERITPEIAAYHPHGAHFQLAAWSVPSGEAIDRYEMRPYNRVPVTVHA